MILQDRVDAGTCVGPLPVDGVRRIPSDGLALHSEEL